MIRLAALTIALLLAPINAAYGEDSPKVHKKVQQALSWELPENKCVPPKAPGKSKQVTDDLGSTHTEWDVDSYTLERYQRKENRWKKCEDRYKARLVNDFETLKNSAQYGLTKPQADIILGKMKQIQEVLVPPQAAAG